MRQYTQEQLVEVYLEHFAPLARAQNEAGLICHICRWLIETTPTGANMLIPYRVRMPDTGWEDREHRVAL